MLKTKRNQPQISDFLKKSQKNPILSPKTDKFGVKNLLEINQTVATLKCHSCEQRKICDYTCQIIGQ
jgi:hypothetical protein